jgi:hypothetical protein
MLTEPSARAAVAGSAGRVARGLVLASDSPIATVQVFCDELKGVTGSGGLKAWLGRQRLLAHIWARVTAILMETVSPQNRWAARYAALYAVLYNPTQLRHKVMLKLLAHALLG